MEEAILSLFVRVLLTAGGVVASWLVANDALNYPIVKMVAAIFLFVLGIGLAILWPKISAWFRREKSKP